MEFVDAQMVFYKMEIVFLVVHQDSLTSMEFVLNVQVIVPNVQELSLHVLPANKDLL